MKPPRAGLFFGTMALHPFSKGGLKQFWVSAVCQQIHKTYKNTRASTTKTNSDYSPAHIMGTHTEAQSNTAQHTHAQGLGDLLFPFPQGSSVHARLESDSTQSIGWFRSRPGSPSLAESPTNPTGCFHHRAQCVPVQTQCGAASRPPGLPGPAHNTETDTWQHIIPPPQSEG